MSTMMHCRSVHEDIMAESDLHVERSKEIEISRKYIPQLYVYLD